MGNPFDKFDTAAAGANPFDRFDAPSLSDQIPGTPRRFPVSAADLKRSQELGTPEKTWRDDSLRDMLYAPAETVMSLGSAVGAGAIAPTAGFIQSMFNGKDPEKNASALAESMVYQPRSGTAQQMVGAAGKALAPLATLPTFAMLEGAQAIRSGGNALRGRVIAPAQDLIQRTNTPIVAADAASVLGAKPLSLFPKKADTLAGVGAAATPEATQRAERFAAMRAPMQPTKGILSRSIDDVQFEREAAKRPEGRALDNRFAELNRGMEQHMEALADETGAQASSARATGKVVTNAMEMKQAAKKKEIKEAYLKAKASGEMAELVDAQPLLDFVEMNRSAAKNAPIISAVESEVHRLADETGRISINDMEQIRQMTGKLSEPGKPNGVYGTDAIKLIDDITDGKGGPAYQQARRLYENFSNEFKNREVVAKLLRTKRGTKDRAVAYEDVADSILMDGSLDDMKHAFRVLEAHPVGAAPEIVAAGQQAAKELRGAAVNKMKERMFSNAGADSSGKVVGSEAQMKRVVAELDKDGKLDFLFGKQGAQEIRDTVQVASDLYSTPKGSVNSSNTASAMEKVLDRMSGTFGGTPVVGHAIKYGAKKLESRNYAKKVNMALNPMDFPTLSN